MPALIEIAYDHSDSIKDVLLPTDVPYYFTYLDPQTLIQRAMLIECMDNDSFTKVNFGIVDDSYDTSELRLDRKPVILPDQEGDIWKVRDGFDIGLIAVEHASLLVSDFSLL